MTRLERLDWKRLSFADEVAAAAWPHASGVRGAGGDVAAVAGAVRFRFPI